MRHSGDCRRRGFTLIELSIVLVIIGLLVGGVLVGQDLIKSAQVRATVTQIEKYQTAVNTFRGKYNALPGDMPAAIAGQFGFTPRGNQTAQGDGNGVIEGNTGFGCGTAGGCPSGYTEVAGETAMFWVDLTSANGQNLNLVEGSFNSASPNNNAPTPNPAAFLPSAKIGNGNYIYVWSGGVFSSCCNGTNYFSIVGVGRIDWWPSTTLPLTVQQAYMIDKKADDGLPQSGNITATYVMSNNGIAQGAWAAGGGGWSVGASPGTAANPSSTTCYDNSGNASAPMVYSLGQNNGAGMNCALSFQFQ